jgi:hypothetical protein
VAGRESCVERRRRAAKRVVALLHHLTIRGSAVSARPSVTLPCSHKKIADAVKAAGVEHIISSSLEDTRQPMKPDEKRMPILQCEAKFTFAP